MALNSAIKGTLLSVIGDEDTCVGLLFGGVGEINKYRHPNFMVVVKNTAVSEIEDCLKRFLKRDDIDIILINQNYAELIRQVIDVHTSPVPAVLEIPSKYHPDDASKDSILNCAGVRLDGTNFSANTSNNSHFLSIDFARGHVQPQDQVR